MTVSYATREGARSGAAFAQGNASVPCATIDQNIIIAVQRVLTAPGSLVNRNNVANITIFKAQTDGTPVANASNVWTNDGAGNFLPPASVQWNACSRVNGMSPDSIGVAITYNYKFVTPLSAALGFFGPPGGAGLTIRDRTVMALNPIN
jgi:hypothetical protein